VIPIGVKFCMMVDMAPGRVLSPIGGGTPKGSQKSKILAVKNEYLENGISRSEHL